MSLEGKRILVTRAEQDAGSLADLLELAGAQPIAAPTIAFEPPEDVAPLDDVLLRAVGDEFAWIVFATPRAVNAFGERMKAHGVQAPLPAKIGAVGPSTVAALEVLGFRADFMPIEFTSKELAATFPKGEGKVLLPRADIAPPDLEEGLASRGWMPIRVTAYRTVHPAALPDEARLALSHGWVDALAFTSASTVRGFVRMAGGAEAVPNEAKVACIGPVTAEAAGLAGLQVDAVAEPHTIEGLVEALKGLFP